MKKTTLLSAIILLFSFNLSGKTVINHVQTPSALEENMHTDAALEIDSDGNSIGCNAYTDYYKNGGIKEVGCQGYYHGTGTVLGMTYEYDENSRLIRTTYYHPDEFGKDYKIIKEYDKTGKIISEKIFNNDALYEVEEKELHKIPK